MKEYDGFFILYYLITNILPSEKLPEILLNGSKVLVIKLVQLQLKIR